MQICITISWLYVTSSSDLLLARTSILWPFGLIPQLLALEFDFPNWISNSLWSSPLPLWTSLCLLCLALPGYGKLSSGLLSLPLSHCFDFTKSLPSSDNSQLLLRKSTSQQNRTAQVWSPCVHRTPYNLSLEHQRPRLKHTQWLILTESWSLSSRRFTPNLINTL